MEQSLFQIILKEILYIRKYWRDNWYIRKAVRGRARAKKLADMKHKTDGKRYYVLPDYNGDLMAINSMEIEQLKRAKIMSRKVTIHDLLTESVYFTGMDPKEEEKRGISFIQKVIDEIRKARLSKINEQVKGNKG